MIMNLLKSIAVGVVVLLLGGCASVPGGGVSPQGKAVLATVFMIGAARLASEHPAEAKTAAVAATLLAEGLRKLAGDNTSFTVAAAVKLAMEKSGVDVSTLHPEARFWLSAVPTLLNVYATGNPGEPKVLDSEALLKAADKIDEVVAQFLLI